MHRGPPTETYAFYDPETGMTYRAHGVGTETDLRATCTRRASARACSSGRTTSCRSPTSCERDGNGDPVLNADGTPKLVLDGEGQPQLEPDTPAQRRRCASTSTTSTSSGSSPSTFNRPLDDGSLPQP